MSNDGSSIEIIDQSHSNFQLEFSIFLYQFYNLKNNNLIFREEKRTANIIADDENGVACLVIDRESFNHLIANLEDIKTRYVDLPERKKIIHQEFKALKLSDMRIIATLGVGKSN